MAHKLNIDGSKETLTDTKLETLQKAVGGFIQVVPTNDGRLLILDEEGKLKGYPVNWHATALTRGIVAPDDLIVGDTVVAEEDEMD